MIKKEYIEPQMEVLNGELQQMICVSEQVDSNPITDPNDIASFDVDFEEDFNANFNAEHYGY